MYVCVCVYVCVCMCLRMCIAVVVVNAQALGRDSIRLLASQYNFTTDEAFPEIRDVQLGR
jgi:hypothetical protein